MNASKETVARRLAQSHLDVEPGLVAVYRILAQNESNPEEPIKLLEVNEASAAVGVRPIYFGPHRDSDVHYPSTIVDVTPAEYESI